MTDPSGACWSARRDPFGQVVEQTDPLGAVSALCYDGEGRLVSRVGPDGTGETWRYDVDGNLVGHQDQAGAVTAFEAGPFGAVTARVDADGARYAFTYDTELRPTKVDGPTGRSWTYSYDEAGRLAGEVDFNGRQLSYDHDPAGRLVRRVNGADQAVELIRDNLGRIVEQRADGAPSTVFAYDAAGHLARARNGTCELTFTFDQLGRLLSESSDGRWTTSTYDAAGHRVSLTTPSGRRSSWTYDRAGNPIELASPEQRIFFGYDPVGQEAYRWLSARVALTRQWDASGRESAMHILAVEGADEARSSRTVLQRAYGYRVDGVLSRTSDSTCGTRHYGLDALGRVTSVTGSDWHARYAYDLAGNLLLAEDSRTPDTVEAGEREVAGTLLTRAGRTRYEYDGQGRLTKTIRRTLSGQS